MGWIIREFRSSTLLMLGVVLLFPKEYAWRIPPNFRENRLRRIFFVEKILPVKAEDCKPEWRPLIPVPDPRFLRK